MHRHALRRRLQAELGGVHHVADETGDRAVDRDELRDLTADAEADEDEAVRQRGQRAQRLPLARDLPGAGCGVHDEGPVTGRPQPGGEQGDLGVDAVLRRQQDDGAGAGARAAAQSARAAAAGRTTAWAATTAPSTLLSAGLPCST